MTDYTGPYSAQDQAQPSTTALARDEAANVGQSAAEAGSHVAQTATDQARMVASETARQARDLLGEASGQAVDQASVQQQRAARQLRTVADELQEMAAKGGQSGVATEVAHQAAERIHGAASWLEQREPADLLQAVRDFARRRPGVFLASAAAVGLVAGRLTRGATAAARSNGQPVGSSQRSPREIPHADAEPYYPVSGVPGPGAAGPADPTAPGRDYPARGGYQGSGYDEGIVSEETGFPDSGPETYRRGQQP